MTDNLKIVDLLKSLEGAPSDTRYSKVVFEIEEGKKYKDTGKHEWIEKSECDEKLRHSQKFHLKYYLEDKLSQNETHANFAYINNGALLLYIYEVVLQLPLEEVTALYELMLDYYQNQNGECNKFKSTGAYRKWKNS